MVISAPLTIWLSQNLKKKLGQLAKDTRRSESDLGAEAVSSFIEREFPILEGIRRGIADVERAGASFPTKEATAEIDAVIESVRRRRY